MRRVLAFGMVGATGFAVDAGVLASGLHVGLDPLIARIISIGSALLVTYVLNRAVTFGKSDRSVAVEGLRYGGVGLSSAGLNYLIYAGLLLTFPRLMPLAALVAASAAAALFSYFGYQKLVFRRP
jgi:putative flippase GtrA